VTDWRSGPYVRDLVAASSSATYSVHPGPQWTVVRRTDVQLPEHGWKLHVSSRAETFPELAERLVPVLLAEGCGFKLAAGTAVLAGMNQGHESPASVGKAVTIYPDQSRVRELGLALADLLRGHAGPRILSDLRVDEEAPVYYRYGPFIHRWYRGQRGVMSVGILGPDGEVFDALAGLEYRQPSWVTDPFRPTGEPEAPELLGDRYRVSLGVQRMAQGSVYRGQDVKTGRDVIVKQARAYVGDPGDGADARARLRNERRVLAACEGVDGTPDLVDHFAHGEDEFLVTTDVGGEDLHTRVGTTGAMLPAGAPVPAEFARLATQLAGIVLALHARAVVMRDITPRNVVLGTDRAFLVDFGISALDGLHPPGGTPGFAPTRQMRQEPARPEDDHHALGMTLAFAATALIPVAGETRAGLAAERMLQSLSAIHGSGQPVFTALVTDLVSGVPERSAAAVRALAEPDWPDRPARFVRVRRPAVPSAAELERQVLGTVLSLVDKHLLEQPPAAFASIDGSVYTGSAGLGLELLHHRDHGDVPEVLRRLAAHTVSANERSTPLPGLFLGSTGSHLFLGQMAAAGFDVPLPPIPDPPYQTEDEHDDVITGTAGVGLGHLFLFDALGDPAHLDAARVCVEHLMARPELTMAVRTETGLPEAVATDPAASYSHGRAGVIDLLLMYAARTGDPAVWEEIEIRSRDLRRRTAELVGRSVAPGAVPISVSWCQGLAGIGRTLLHAAELFDDTEYRSAALTAADTCAGWLPRMQNLGQCCGLTGVGGFLLDCARYTGAERYSAAAQAVARQLLTRSHGPDEAPLFVDLSAQDAPLSWATGYGGILTFLRRLHRPDTPELVPISQLRPAVPA
jgi:serine/threonine protein kinase